MNQNIQRGSILERNGVRTKRVAGSPKNDNRLATVNLPCVCVRPSSGIAVVIIASWCILEECIKE